MAATPHLRTITTRVTPRRALLSVAGLLLVFFAYTHLADLLRPPASPKAAFHTGVLRIGVDPSRPPFAFFTPDGQLAGLEIDLGNALGDVFELPVRFVPLGFDGLYDALRTDQVDVVIAGLQPVRHVNGNAAVYSRHYYNAGLVLVSERAYEDMHDLSGKALAYEFGSPSDAIAHRWLRRARPFDLLPYELPEYALDALRLGVADAALVDATSARLYLREHPTLDVHQEHITHAYYTIVSRSDRLDVLAVINAAVQRLDDDDTLEMLIARWL